MALKTFGKVPAGERLERIKQSPNYKNGSFQNLSETTLSFTPQKMIDTLRRRKIEKEKEPQFPLPGIQTNLDKIESNAPTIVWFGHSSYLININGKNILVDPVFSGYAAPFKFGVKAYKHEAVYDTTNMPDIDILVQTHDHYDHLDYNTILELKDRVKKFIMPLGVGAHFEHWGINNNKIHELDWHESITLFDDITFTALPSRHFSGRGLNRNQSLWASYALQVQGYKLYLGGDSGYDFHFKEIGKQHGPFDLSILECGQYDKNWSQIHMMPEETVQAAVDLNSKLLLPVHWGKFTLSLHAWNSPIQRATAHAEKLGVNYATPLIGEPFTLGESAPTTRWWEVK